MNLWFFFTVLSVVAMAGGEISQKLSLNRKLNIHPITNNFYVWLFMGIFGISVSLILNSFTFVSNFLEFLKLLILGFTYFLGSTFYYTSYKGNSPSISMILASFSVIISTTLGVVFLQESIFLNKILGIVLILISLILINLNVKEKFEKYNIFALLGGFFYGIAYTIDKSFVLNINPATYIGLIGFLISIISITVRPNLILKESKNMRFNDFKPIFLAFVFFFSYFLFTFYAYIYGGSVGVVDSMNGIAFFIVLAFEVFVLKDKSNLFKKIFCSFIAFLGLVIFSQI